MVYILFHLRITGQRREGLVRANIKINRRNFLRNMVKSTLTGLKESYFNAYTVLVLVCVTREIYILLFISVFLEKRDSSQRMKFVSVHNIVFKIVPKNHPWRRKCVRRVTFKEFVDC